MANLQEKRDFPPACPRVEPQGGCHQQPMIVTSQVAAIFLCSTMMQTACLQRLLEHGLLFRRWLWHRPRNGAPKIQSG